jgi:hypothetical protein
MNDIINDENNRIAYSDKNKKAKYAPEYSVLKPDTNSDSDSEKSNGARWSSAIDVINQIIKKVRKKIDDISENDRKLKEKINKANSTSNVEKTDS